MQIALQLYSIREQLKADFEGTLQQVAAMGYRAVETAGDYGGSVERGAALFKSLGLKVISAHGRPEGNLDPWFSTLAALGTQTLVYPWVPAERVSTLDGVRSVCDELNGLYDALHSRGIRLAYHNHDFELTPLSDGSLPLLRMAELLHPGIEFEVDAYWVQTGGANVLDVLNTLGKRATLLHIKDGSTRRGDPMVAVGDGVMHYPPIFHASHAEAYIVELDHCATDMLQAVGKSYLALQRMLAL
jgi:sugar phosphate isomerase/epimerase